MILNLDNNFNPYPNEKSITYEMFTFSGGEPHIKIQSDLSRVNEVTITQRVKSFNDVGKILIAVNALRGAGVQEVNLLLPYFPGARQDRFMVNGEALTVKVYTDLFNQLSFKSVIIFDPHSDVTPALLNNPIVVENYRFIEKVIAKIGSSILLVSPDGGALKKIYKLASYLNKYNVIECSKSRDVNSGKLSAFKVYADNLEGKDCLIVDDICDGGRTFIGLAQELKSKNCGKLYLAISHGIFSKGLRELSNQYEMIFTTNSFSDFEDVDSLTQINFDYGLLS